jgi:hypothetical protein
LTVSRLLDYSAAHVSPLNMHDFDETGYLGEGIQKFKQQTLAPHAGFLTFVKVSGLLSVSGD